MRLQYRCKNEKRRQGVRDHPSLLNGIDYIEVLDHEAPDESKRQRTLLVYCLKQVPDLTAMNVEIHGGVRVTPVRVLWVARALDAEALFTSGLISKEERDFFLYQPDPDHLLLVRTDVYGDFSSYRLSLVRSPADPDPPNNFDPILSCVDFSFKIECPSDFDCRAMQKCPPERTIEPLIDYLAKDYTSFRQLMLDRLSLIMPDWKERNPADLGIVLVELLAYAGDHLSYYQDAVATEAYLNTARKRISLRRHSRLLDYQMHDGCNSRVWVCLEVDDDVHLKRQDDDGCITRLLTRGAEQTVVDHASWERVVDANCPLVFEPLHDVSLCPAHNCVFFYTWEDDMCCLPKGATNATLRDNPDNRLRLRAGDVLIFEERVGAATGEMADADPAHRHAVRLTHVSPPLYLFSWNNVPGNDEDEKRLLSFLKNNFDIAWEESVKISKSDGDKTIHITIGENSAKITIDEREEKATLIINDDRTHDLLVKKENGEPNIYSPLTDPLNGQTIVEIKWHHEDALPFPLCISTRVKGEVKTDMACARGNVVLADHGRTFEDEALLPEVVPETGRYRPHISRNGITFSTFTTSYDNNKAQEASASFIMAQEPREALPAVHLTGDGDVWSAQRDLLGSDRFAPEFVVELEEDGMAHLRFGDDVLGRKPATGAALKATYRVGNGRMGNVGAMAIAHVVPVGSGTDSITRVWNPLAAQGGTDAEKTEEVRLYAPQAFRIQQRAVTEADYAEVVQRHPEVQKAVATLRWTGSWYTMFITVDRKGGYEVDDQFERDLRDFLERFRMAGHDIEIDAPHFVPLDIAFSVCVAPDYLRSDLKQVLLETFSNIGLPGGQRGFFHPDNYTFGQPVYLSQIVAKVMKVPGVLWIDTSKKPAHHFKRWRQPPGEELDEGMITFDRLEIARLDNDPNFPENGRIEFFMEGGL